MKKRKINLIKKKNMVKELEEWNPFFRCEWVNIVAINITAGFPLFWLQFLSALFIYIFSFSLTAAPTANHSHLVAIFFCLPLSAVVGGIQPFNSFPLLLCRHTYHLHLLSYLLTEKGPCIFRPTASKMRLGHPHTYIYSIYHHQSVGLVNLKNSWNFNEILINKIC